eukprot:5603347-Alexandrium_andersonii.AAC.1
MSASLVGSEMCIRDSSSTSCPGGGALAGGALARRRSRCLSPRTRGAPSRLRSRRRRLGGRRLGRH